MSNNICAICLNNGRPVKFSSKRIQVCQWCVTLLQDKQIIPEKIDAYVLAKVKKHARKPPQKPRLEGINEKDQQQLKHLARSFVLNQESFFEGIINSIFNKNQRDVKIQQIYEVYEKQEKERRETIENKNKQVFDDYLRKLDKYESDIEEEIRDSCKKFISGEYLPPGLGTEDNKIIKYIRGYKYHLLAGLSKLLRPNEEEIVALRADIKKEDNYTCKVCSKSGDGVELHVHHIIPLDKYGSNHPNNLITLCHSCHNKQHSGFQVTRNIPIRRVRTGGEFIAVDIETTGLSSKEDHIIELAAVKYKAANVIDEFWSLINPNVSIPHKITQLTGINEHMVAMAPTIDNVFHEFIEFIGDSTLVFHNSTFDMRFINKYAQLFGYQIQNEIVDTLHLSRKKLPHLNNHKLQTLVWHFNIKTNGKHRALADSHATGQVYIECLRAKK